VQISKDNRNTTTAGVMPMAGCEQGCWLSYPQNLWITRLITSLSKGFPLRNLVENFVCLNTGHTRLPALQEGYGKNPIHLEGLS
jgi:hypothetical protein